MVKKICSVLVMVGVFCSISFGDMVKFVNSVDKVTRDGSYAGLYKIEVTKDGASEEYFTFCIDPLGTIYEGNTWEVDYLNGNEIVGNGILCDGAIYDNTELSTEKYKMISFLANKVFYDGDEIADFTFDNASKNTRANYNAAIWDISENYNGSKWSLESGTRTLLSGYDSESASIDMAVFSPTGYKVNYNGSRKPYSQEFLAFKTKTTSVPEPALFSLLGMGLLGMAVIRRRK